jgi:MFS family permease
MPARELTAIILASALITLDGTAVTVALPAIGRSLAISFSRLQWITNAPLLMLAALLLPAGALADRYGRTRIMRIGLLSFGLASLACAAASSGEILIAARLLQGAGGALVLPGAVARLRTAYSEPAARTRKFGLWAAWTGVASAVGPLLGGGLADLLSWRAAFLVSSAGALTALLLLRGTARDEGKAGAAVPVLETTTLVVLLGAVAYLLIEGRMAGWASPRVMLAVVLVIASVTIFVRSSRRHVLFPRELLTTQNCVPANAATFALYFGMFGLTFLLVFYTQQALNYSAVWAAAGVLPISVMLFPAERLGRVAPRVGTRAVIALGSVLAAGGILWMAAGPDPLPFWSRIVVGTCLFGLGVSMAVSPLTHAAISAVPEDCAGAASGLNHATVRAAGLIAIAVLGSIAAEGHSDGITAVGFRRALTICGSFVAVVGVTSAWRIRNEAPGGLEAAND